jgi:hypothetical protein
MLIPFSVEVERAAKSLKNNKSAGCDQLKAELIKHGPPIIYEGIAQLLNHMGKTGEYPEEIKKDSGTTPQTRKATRTSTKCETHNTPIQNKENSFNHHDNDGVFRASGVWTCFMSWCAISLFNVFFCH